MDETTEGDERMKIIDEIVLIRNYIGNAIDKGFPMTTEHLNELWQWIDSLLEAEE